ncbi:hypothetical protein KKB43_02845 [Patescibacteria group bacterium]|nr:hypothetical protein [Patescibacteria group bacterium]MBU4579930.1 hypothetical protein [Patescibacteria group bacterium]
MDKFKPRLTSGVVEKRAPKNPKTAQELREESKNIGHIERGKNYAKEKLSKAQEAKQDFEDRMNMFRDSAEESARQPALKQEYGESDKAFLERQRAANKNGPENPKKMGLKDAAIQHGKNKVKEQTDRAKKYGREQAGKAAQAVLKSNPKLAKAVANADERAKAIQDKIAKIKNSNVAKRIKMLRDKYNAKKLIKKKIEDEAKKLALKIAQATARIVLQIIISVVSALSAIFIKLLVVVLIVVVIMVAIDYTCNINILTDAACSAVSGIASWLPI